MYDWANSAYSTTIMAGFFPLFYKGYWSAGADAVVTTARLGTTLSISSLLIAILSPILGILADFKGYKKRLNTFFMVIGVLCCSWMYFIPSGDWISATLSFGIGMFAFSASAIFYDSLLPFVARGKDMNMASSLGYALGYLGGGILFALNVWMYLSPATFFLPDGVAAVKFSFLSVAIWWLIFSFPMIINVPEPQVDISSDRLFLLTKKSLHKLFQTLLSMTRNRNTFLFLVAYWLYIDGVYTVMTMAVDYGIAIGLESNHLITALLLTQFIGFPFTLMYGLISKKFGNRIPILTCIVIYAITVVLATKMSTVSQFYALATVIGMVQGGVQALSRSLFAQMVPVKSEGEYFALFNLVGRFASILGPVVVGWGTYLTQNSRMGMMGLLILFVIGSGCLFFVKEPHLEGEKP